MSGHVINLLTGNAGRIGRKLMRMSREIAGDLRMCCGTVAHILKRRGADVQMPMFDREPEDGGWGTDDYLEWMETGQPPANKRRWPDGEPIKGR